MRYRPRLQERSIILHNMTTYVSSSYSLSSVMFSCVLAQSCITAEDDMSKQQIFANCTSQHYLHILDVPASRPIFVPDLMSGLKKTSQESSLTIMKTQKCKQIRGIANQGSFARHCRLYSCLYDQDICINLDMTCIAFNVFQALT